MNENLSEMIREGDEVPQMFSEQDLSLPEVEETPVQEEAVVSEPEVVAPPTIGVISLTDWFEENCEAFDNINEVKVSIRGVDSSKTLIMAVKDNSGEVDEEGNEKRILRLFENSDIFPVLNIPGHEMEIYTKGFQINYDYNEDIFVKCYGIKMGLIVVFCHKINSQAIPYHIARLKKKDFEVEVVSQDNSTSVQKLTEPINLEDLQLLYNQSTKAEGLTTVQSAVDWLLERQVTITDINHLLQIDNVIISLLG